MATHKLQDLDVDGVIAFLTTMRLEQIFGNEFRKQQIDGELLFYGIGSSYMDIYMDGYSHTYIWTVIDIWTFIHVY